MAFGRPEGSGDGVERRLLLLGWLGASRSAFHSPEQDLVQMSSCCDGRGGYGNVRCSRPSQGHGRLGGCLGSVWEEAEVNSTECGRSYGGLKFSVKKGSKVFVVECMGCGAFRGEILGAL